MNILMVGDVVGEPGLAALETLLPQIIREHTVDFTVVNGENAADGFGLTEATLRRILASGADVVSSGNHVWEKRDFWPFMDTEKRVLRPANYPPLTDTQAPGRGWIRLEKTVPAAEAAAGAQAVSVLVLNLQGREFMNAIDCPFRCFDAVFESEGRGAAVILVDFHAESTREKESLAYYLDGRASLVAGTHTHVQTADERVLPKGTGYITDLGMTGVTDSVIGMDPKICLERAEKQVLYRMELARADGGETGHEIKTVVQGILAEIDQETGKARSIQRI